MTKARWFFWIMWVNIVAFFIEAVSGFVVWFILPYSSKPISPAPLFIFDRRTWIVIHQWGSIAITAMVLVHVALHWKWIVKMAKSLIAGGKENTAPSPAPAAHRYIPAPARGETPAYQAMAVKVAEGLGYLNSREQGYVWLENSGALGQSGASRQAAAATHLRPAVAVQSANAAGSLPPASGQVGVRTGTAAATADGQVKVVTCLKCRGQIGWRLDLGPEGACPHCGALLHV